MTALNKTKPSIKTLEAAVEEFKDKGVVKSIYCEKCNHLINIIEVGDSVLQVRCNCGMYDDNLRGL